MQFCPLPYDRTAVLREWITPCEFSHMHPTRKWVLKPIATGAGVKQTWAFVLEEPLLLEHPPYRRLQMSMWFRVHLLDGTHYYNALTNELQRFLPDSVRFFEEQF